MTVQCIACEGALNSQPTLRLSYYRLMACKDCQSLTALPRKTQSEMTELHSDDEYMNHPYFENRDYANLNSSRGKAEYIKTCLGEISGLSFVDVGSFKGEFVYFLTEHEKVSATGIDIIPQAVEFMKKNGLPAKLGDLHAVGFASESVDVITAFDLIEHVSSPKSFLQEAHRILKPGGALFLETPNVHGFIYQVSYFLNKLKLLPEAIKERLFPSFHIQYFSESGLKTLIKQSEFSEVRISYKELELADIGKTDYMAKLTVLMNRYVGSLLSKPTNIRVFARK